MARMKLPFASEAFAKGFIEGVKYVNDSSVDTDNATITPVRDDLFILEFEDEDENREDEDSYPNKECPDCGDSIPDDASDGDECENCGHVFVMQPRKDEPEPEAENTVKAILYFCEEDGTKHPIAEKLFKDSLDPSKSVAIRQKIEEDLVEKNFDDRLYAASCSPVVEFIEQDDEQDDDTE